MTREALGARRETVRRIERTSGRVLAFLSVGLGLAQLVFLRWAETHLAKGDRLAIGGAAFVVYIGGLALLLWRMERRLRAARPVCPVCGAPLKGLSERLAAVTGRCDSCGGLVLDEA